MRKLTSTPAVSDPAQEPRPSPHANKTRALQICERLKHIYSGDDAEWVYHQLEHVARYARAASEGTIQQLREELKARESEAVRLMLRAEQAEATCTALRAELDNKEKSRAEAQGRFLTERQRLTDSEEREAVLRAELTRLTQARDAQTWQPIETAPKDGSEVYVHDKGAVCIAWWSVTDNAWMAPGPMNPAPTEWMPLPPTLPPSPTAGEPT